tara:strand:+ start:202 stop:1317 length:1116 start_codon:yes stop_codon:yes gene_type:complete
MECKIYESCSGCQIMHIPYEQQLKDKANEALTRLGLEHSPGMVSGGKFQYRSRLDFTFERIGESFRFGLYSKERGGLVDIDTCPVLDDELNQALSFFRNNPPPIVEKGSVRIRISPAKDWGIWLDFSNINVKQLFDEKEWLSTINNKFIVEVGQRNKRLIWDGSRFKLIDPVPHDWFVTPIDGGELDLPLYTTIGGFTQSGFDGNKQLVKTVLEFSQDNSITNWVELFGGSGNFTFPLASLGFKVSMFEVDKLALVGFQKSLEGFKKKENIEVHRQNLYSPKVDLDIFSKHSGLLVDPPRSGLKTMISRIAELSSESRPPVIIYVSCFLDSLANDVHALAELGYEIDKVCGVDQFAQTSHCEWVVRLTQKP